MISGESGEKGRRRDVAGASAFYLPNVVFVFVG